MWYPMGYYVEDLWAQGVLGDRARWEARGRLHPKTITNAFKPTVCCSDQQHTIIRLGHFEGQKQLL